MTKIDLINRMIIDLDHLTVQGVGNMSIVLRLIDGLKTLGDALKKEEGDKPKLEVLSDESAAAE